MAMTFDTSNAYLLHISRYLSHFLRCSNIAKDTLKFHCIQTTLLYLKFYTNFEFKKAKNN